MIDREIAEITPKKELCGEIWSPNGKLLPAVRTKLLRIAHTFITKADIAEIGLTPKKATLTGSLANYNYGKGSDVDLHIIYSGGSGNEMARKYLSFLKNKYNSDYDLQIGGHEVEIYFQHKDEEHHSSGVYDIVAQEWVSRPEPYTSKVDMEQVKRQALDLVRKIKRSDTLADIERTIEEIKSSRKKGLSSKGREYSPENLSYKIVRNLGMVDYLYTKKEALDKIETEYGI